MPVSLDSLMAVKEPFDAAYTAQSPIPYYRGYAATRLSVVEYPATLVRAALELGVAEGPVVDLGCGYGTLGVLLRTGMNIEEVFSRYLTGDMPQLPSTEGYSPRIVGVDRSRPALLAAQDAGFLDESLALDLNTRSLDLGGHGRDAIAVCCAVLGYVRPAALRVALDALRPRLAIVTCVTWLLAEFRRAFTASDYALTSLSEVPLFQRWATTGEELRMPETLIQGAHRAHCFALSTDAVPAAVFADRVERLRARRADSAWLAAGRREGCELAPV
jgi:SAM-dependent methyltransferase